MDISIYLRHNPMFCISNLQMQFMSVRNVRVFRRCFIFADIITFHLTIDNANLVFVINCLKIKEIIIILFHIVLKEIVCQQEEEEVFYWVATTLATLHEFYYKTR